MGTFLGLGSVASSEVCAAAGLDWVLVDLEHGAGHEQQVGAIVTAAGGYGTATLVRVEQPERIRIGRVLDAGAAGIMAPRVSRLDEVARIAECLHYPPRGVRGVASYNRAARWTLEVDELDRADERAALIVQIETPGALAAVEQIAAHPDVDALFVGPQDLSYALGCPRDFAHPDFRDAVERVARAANAAGKPAGMLVGGAEAAAGWVAAGFRFLAIGSDATLLAGAVHAQAVAVRDGLAEASPAA